MSLSVRGFLSASLLALVAICTLVAPARAETAAEKRAKLEAALRKAVKAAKFGPTARDLEVVDHTFHVKKASYSLDGRTTVIKGQISHVLHLRPDDQVNYTIRKREGKVVSVDIAIDRGGITKYVTRFLGEYLNLAGQEEDIGAFIRRVANKLTGEWESTADLMVNVIAMEMPDLYVAKKPPVQNPPRNKTQSSAPVTPPKIFKK